MWTWVRFRLALGNIGRLRLDLDIDLGWNPVLQLRDWSGAEDII